MYKIHHTIFHLSPNPIHEMDTNLPQIIRLGPILDIVIQMSRHPLAFILKSKHTQVHLSK